MSQLVPISSPALPSLVVAAGERASMSFLEFFAATSATRIRLLPRGGGFFEWCASAGVPSIAAVQPVHVATWIEASTRESWRRPRSSSGLHRCATYSIGWSTPKSCRSIQRTLLVDQPSLVPGCTPARGDGVFGRHRRLRCRLRPPHSAGSPSTGRDNLPERDAIARSHEQCGGLLIGMAMIGHSQKSAGMSKSGLFTRS
jgi:hypothetical protein